MFLWFALGSCRGGQAGGRVEGEGSRTSLLKGQLSASALVSVLWLPPGIVSCFCVALARKFTAGDKS